MIDGGSYIITHTDTINPFSYVLLLQQPTPVFMMSTNQASSDFPIGETAQEIGLPYVPQCYQIPPQHNPPSLSDITAVVPVVDISGLRGTKEQRDNVVRNIGDACLRMGFFQVIHHGISMSDMSEALSVASEFFELPMEEKMIYKSNDVTEPVRYGSSLRDGIDKIQFWRVFLKHYAHPLQDWTHLWPNTPNTYREKMGKYCIASRKLAMELTEAITESLGLCPNYLTPKLDDGVQVMAVNCYPPCPDPNSALGLPPHSDYSCLTICLQDSPGLQILDPEDQTWKLVRDVSGALLVHVGDHLEVLSNGKYKSVLHRVVLSSEKTRISIASLHSLGMDVKMETAEELVSETNPRGYRESSFRDFLEFLVATDISTGENSFISTLKI